MYKRQHHDHVEGLGISCDLCDPECNGACEIQNQIPTHNQEKSNLGEGDYLEHKHNHHHHHHSFYPNSKHPLGPVTLRLPNEDQILRKSVENQ